MREMSKSCKMLCSVVLACILTVLFVVAPVCADGIYNTYKGTEYKTEEEILALEETLKADGYVLVDNTLFGELKENGYNYFTYLSEENKVYATADSWKNYLETKDVSGINQNTVIVSNYTNEIVDEGTMSDNKDNNVKGDWGTIIIKGKMDADILNDKNHTPATVILYNDTTKEKYKYELDFYNNYTVSAKVPIGTYHIYSAFIDEIYPPTFDKALEMDGKGVELTALGSQMIDVEFGESISKEDYEVGKYHKEKQTEETKEKVVSKWIPVAILIAFAGVLVALGVIAYRFKKKVERQNS